LDHGGAPLELHYEGALGTDARRGGVGRWRIEARFSLESKIGWEDDRFRTATEVGAGLLELSVSVLWCMGPHRRASGRMGKRKVVSPAAICGS
jgi:hypothetical protein